MKVTVSGASGRMGQMLIAAIGQAPDMTLWGALDRPGSSALGREAATDTGAASPRSVRITADLAEALDGADVLIDFTAPEATMAHLEHCTRAGVRMVIGTTGLDTHQRARIASAARNIAIVHSANMSVGVNVLLALAEQATRALGEDTDIEIIEAHHRHKVDAPSGTALWIGETIAATLGKPLEDLAVHARHGQTGARSNGSIGFSVIRGGDIVGDHTVLYAGDGERIEITHRSSSRATYAQGSLRACRFLSGHNTGLYTMRDVLGMSSPT